MKLAVSNIAWTSEEEPEVAALLQSLGVDSVEIAPTKQWQDPTMAPGEAIESYQAFWRQYDIRVVAFQSMLFNRPDLQLFGEQLVRDEMQDYLERFIALAGQFGAGALVFGSPKNRQRGQLDSAAAMRIAVPFFAALATVATTHQTTFCIEPNAPQYDCDFITTAQQGIDIVAAVDHPGFGLHLDVACMALAGDDVAHSITAAAPYLRHIHISSPMLQEVGPDSNMPHIAAAQALRDIDYQGFVSIEMRPGEPGSNCQRVETAVRFVQQTYGL